MKMSIELSPAEADRLREEAGRLGVPAEELEHAAIADLFAREDDDFETAARRVLSKNQELYRRPARMRCLSLAEVVELHRRVIVQSGGAAGIRDMGALESAVAQPCVTFGGEDVYPSAVEKAARDVNHGGPW